MHQFSLPIFINFITYASSWNEKYALNTTAVIIIIVRVWRSVPYWTGPKTWRNFPAVGVGVATHVTANRNSMLTINSYIHFHSHTQTEGLAILLKFRFRNIIS